MYTVPLYKALVQNGFICIISSRLETTCSRWKSRLCRVITRNPVLSHILHCNHIIFAGVHNEWVRNQLCSTTRSDRCSEKMNSFMQHVIQSRLRKQKRCLYFLTGLLSVFYELFEMVVWKSNFENKNFI